MQSNVSAAELEKRDERQKRIVKEKQNQERERLMAEAEAHRATMSKEQENRTAEIDLLMGELKGKALDVKLQAYLSVLQRGYDGADLQAAVDETTLRLARYLVTGKV